MNPAAGIGLRGPHLAEIARDRPATAFLEIHAENYLSPTPAKEAIERLRADYAFSVHAVGFYERIGMERYSDAFFHHRSDRS